MGKSTLLNALIGQRLSIVTPRPQTTRHRILGIYTDAPAQIAFVDTPGLHKEAGRALNKAMNRTAAAALEDADLVVLVVEAPRWYEEDELVLERIVRSSRPAMVAVNKIDLVHPRERLLPYLAQLATRYDFRAIVPVSAPEEGRHRGPAQQPSPSSCRTSPVLFPDGELTDRDVKFRISEMIREKLTLELNQEVPYGIAVEVERHGRGGRAAGRGCLHLGGPRGPEADRHRRQGRAAEARGALGTAHAQ